MQYTSAEASKLLRTLTDEHSNLRTCESSLATFGAYANENIEKIRPEYDYPKFQEQLEVLEQKIRIVKHAINKFNLNTVLPNLDGLTIDQALVYLPQLSARKKKLEEMAYRLPKERLQTSRFKATAPISEFVYANYDIAQAQADYAKTVAEITAIQTALDLVNNTESFEIEL